MQQGEAQSLPWKGRARRPPQVLARYGTPEQQARWLLPLLEGRMRSCFTMTEPAVASADATNIQASIVRRASDPAPTLANGQA